MEREGLDGFELLVIVIAGVVLALVGAVWAGAWLVVGRIGWPVAFPSRPQLMRRLVSPANLSAPAEAWPEPFASVASGGSALLVLHFADRGGRLRCRRPGDPLVGPVQGGHHEAASARRRRADSLRQGPRSGTASGATSVAGSLRDRTVRSPPRGNGVPAPLDRPVRLVEHVGGPVGATGERWHSWGRPGRARPPRRSPGSSSGTGRRCCPR